MENILTMYFNDQKITVGKVELEDYVIERNQQPLKTKFGQILGLDHNYAIAINDEYSLFF